jgi:8-oxo-dGTP pyrophosphatase MutT (NUDIX family)
VLPEEFSKYSPSAIYEMIDDLYKGTPTNGIVVLNESNTRVILAKTTSSIKWSFPKGKINENEKRE